MKRKDYDPRSKPLAWDEWAALGFPPAVAHLDQDIPKNDSDSTKP